MMKKMISIFIVLVILIVAITFSIVNSVSTSIDDSLDVYKNELGKSYIYRSDTVYVSDYSVINSTVILDDGRSLNIDLLKTLEPVITYE